jgi:hypothetical protein
MADLEDARRIALTLPSTNADDALAVFDGKKMKGFAWVWLERKDPKKARVPCPDVLAIRTASLEEKEALLAADPEKFFTEPHYDGYRAILVRLAKIECDELEELLIDAWRCTASRALVNEYNTGATRD